MKTFVNAHTCRVAPGCAPTSYRLGVSVVLNHAMLTMMHEVTGKFIYAISGLSLVGSQSYFSPCNGASRWVRRLESACGNQATSLNAETRAFFAMAISGSLDAANPHVRDVVASTVSGVCSDRVAAIGAVIDADGGCWQHTHPSELNVYDFTEWAETLHPGNEDFLEVANPIKAFARAGQTTLAFPSSHPMSRFEDQTFALLGKLGDTFDFASLPSTIQSHKLADAVGALNPAATTETCGSPGEVANEPALGDIWVYQHTLTTGSTTLSKPHSGYLDIHGGGREIFFETAMRADDQLRQRAAWALIQVYVISHQGSNFPWQTEHWVYYYDILLRNAFGNLRDVLTEISWNGMMAGYLSFHGSGSLASSGTLPDENYAREIMQLL